MDTLESEEERAKRRLEKMCEGESTRPSVDAVFLRNEIIDALKRSDERMQFTRRKQIANIDKFAENLKVTQRKQMKRWINVCRQSRNQSGPNFRE